MRCVYVKVGNLVWLELWDLVGSEDWGEMGEYCRNKNSLGILVNELLILMG